METCGQRGLNGRCTWARLSLEGSRARMLCVSLPRRGELGLILMQSLSLVHPCLFQMRSGSVFEGFKCSWGDFRKTLEATLGCFFAHASAFWHSDPLPSEEKLQSWRQVETAIQWEGRDQAQRGFFLILSWDPQEREGKRTRMCAHTEASVEAAIVNRKQSQFIVLFNVLSPLIPEQLCRGGKHS